MGDAQTSETRHKETAKKSENLADNEEPKPRIVLTFRSEKLGVISSTMKIVSSEEKHEETTVRRSSRAHGNEPEFQEEETNGGGNASDTSSSSLKRSTRNKANNETLPVTPQRLSRRIKPTAKILANKELRLGLETQNNARLGITPTEKTSPDEGVRTRRSRRRSLESHTSDDSKVSVTESSPKKKKVQNEEMVNKNEEDSQEIKRLNKMKNKHLSKLGLQAISSEASKTEESTADISNASTKKSLKEDESQMETEETEDPEEELEELEEDYEMLSDDEYDDEFTVSSFAESDAKVTRHSARRLRTVSRNSNHMDSSHDEQAELKPRRSSRLRGAYRFRPDSYSPEFEHSNLETAEDNEPPGGDEGEEAACPEDVDEAMGTCLCEDNSNVYAATSELEEPVFCRAIEMIDGIRVGCSHLATKDEDATYSALQRAGPRTPYVLMCKLHTAQLRRHMCCPSCGLFCTQGTFYECSSGHFFHLECGLSPAHKQQPGCPHCGVHDCQWLQPVNRDCWKVNVKIKCTNKKFFLHEQRVQSISANMTFSTLDPQLDYDPVPPEDLMPEPVDFHKLKESLQGEPPSADALRAAILNSEPAEILVAKMVNMNLNKSIEGGRTCVHIAAECGNLTALYLLRQAGADLDVVDDAGRTPLMLSILALVDKSSNKKKQMKSSSDKVKESDVEEKDDNMSDKDGDHTDDVTKKPASEEQLMKVIRFLVTAGCDVNLPGPEGMTALHLAAQHGLEPACRLVLSSPRAETDPRDHGGWTPLVWAAENKHANTCNLLLKSGAEAGCADSEGNNALHWCALAGAASCLRLLLDAALPSAAAALNAHGDTPLHVAARQGHYSCVGILLARGARTDVENSAGELAVEVSTEECRKAIEMNMQVAALQGLPQRKLLSADISNGRELYPVPCVNEIDDAPAPDDFTYVTSHVMPTNVAIDQTMLTAKGCACVGAECETRAECACAALSVRRWWRRGRLADTFPYHDPPVVFECNQTCRCNMKLCPNTTITRLSRTGALFIRAQVFRYEGARGWGLRAAGVAPRGTPVALYCGELLPASEADARTKDSYMFSLDLKPDLLEQCTEKTQLCVDADQYGSAARFINHSCKPNLVPVKVFTNSRDLRLPLITLFAVRDIKPDEELTFNYGDKFWEVKSKIMKCECGSPECRYSTITKEEDKDENV